VSVVALLLVLGTPPATPFQATVAEAALVRYAPTPAAQAPADPWFGQDKVRHALHSYAAVAFAHAGWTAVGLDGDAALGGAVAVAALLGVGKEVADLRGGRIFSVRDLVWDALGIGVGVLVMRGAAAG
jgi:uncharacterized protein YfiM (DUF2279 family)